MIYNCSWWLDVQCLEHCGHIRGRRSKLLRPCLDCAPLEPRTLPQEHFSRGTQARQDEARRDNHHPYAQTPHIVLVGGNTPFLLLLGVGLFLLGASLFLQGCCNEGPGSQPGGNCGEFLARSTPRRPRYPRTPQDRSGSRIRPRGSRRRRRGLLADGKGSRTHKRGRLSPEQHPKVAVPFLWGCC